MKQQGEGSAREIFPPWSLSIGGLPRRRPLFFLFYLSFTGYLSCLSYRVFLFYLS